MKHLLTITFLLFAAMVFGNTIPVGAGEPYHTLRSAVEAAQPGDTILLKKGVYKEGNIVINKSIFLIGENNPVLHGEDKHEILTVSGEAILIKGITFQNSGYSSMNDYASIKLIDAKNVLIADNTITNAYFAIHVSNAEACSILNNRISGLTKTEQTSGNGIHLWKCNNVQIKGNDVQGHRDGIYFEFVTNSTIEGNNSHNNIRYGLHFMFSNNDSYIDNVFTDNGAGVAVMYSHHVLMQGNRFVHNWGPNSYGILLKEISDAEISLNHFDENTVGILMESTNRIIVQKNEFQNNGWALRISASCNDNTITLNNFSANTFDVGTNGTLTLNKFIQNYWDKADGYDLNKDGLADVPYHPVSMYSMVIEQNPNSVILMRSFMVMLLDKAEKAIPSLIPETMVDEQPVMKKFSTGNAATIVKPEPHSKDITAETILASLVLVAGIGYLYTKKNSK
jgi:nitrous oxidase accessory protein